MFDESDYIPVLPQNFPLCPPNHIVSYFSTVKFTRGAGENIGINEEKELFDVMVNLLPQGLRDTYHTTVLEVCEYNFYNLKIVDIV